MRISHQLMFLCWLVVASQGATQAKETLPTTGPLESVITMQVNGSIAINSNGQVSDLIIETSLSETLRSRLDRTVRAWHFEPDVIDGVPRAARAKVRVTLNALAQGDNPQIRIDNVVFAGDSRGNAMAPLITGKSLPPPRYPGNLLNLGVSGAVVLAVRVGADGQVAQSMVVQSALLDVEGDKSTLGKALRLFERSATDAAKAWRFNVGSKDGPLSAKEMTVVVPITYIMEGKQPIAPRTWRIEVRTPSRPIEWLHDEPDVQPIGVDDVVYGEVLPVDRKLKLVTDVVGTIL
jgi:hypothetical protein